MQIKDILETIKERDIPLVMEDDTIQEVLQKMLKHPHTRLIYVVDADGKCKGIISLGALIRHLFAHGFEPAVHTRFLIPMITSETARHMMDIGVIYASREDAIEAVIKRMIQSGIKEIPILDEEKRIVGDVTMLDLLKYEHLDQV